MKRLAPFLCFLALALAFDALIGPAQAGLFRRGPRRAYAPACAGGMPGVPIPTYTVQPGYAPAPAPLPAYRFGPSYPGDAPPDAAAPPPVGRVFPSPQGTAPPLGSQDCAACKAGGRPACTCPDGTCRCPTCAAHMAVPPAVGPRV